MKGNMKIPTQAGALKRSAVNAPAPLRAEIASHGKKAPVTEPNKPDSMKNRVLVNEKAPAGRDSSKSTFTAPRKDAGSSPAECGYTKLGKA